MHQSAVDSNCAPSDFCREDNVIVHSVPNPAARKYLTLPFYCDLTSYGINVVASVSTEIEGEVKNYLSSFAPEHCFETPNLHVLNDALQKRNMCICFMAEYFLPDVNALTEQRCRYRTELLTSEDFSGLYTGEWSNALCERRKQFDVLGVGAYDNGRLIGLAGCSADCDTMWQIGIDVLPEYRRQGIASALTSQLALEILHRDRVPFYCAAWSNIRSVRNAIKCGFRPSWVQMTAKSAEEVAKMNHKSD